MPKNAMVSTDVGNSSFVANSYLRFENSPSYFAAMTYGSCQYSFPCAIGTKLACPDRPAIAYVGDGAWGMTCNEVMTCIREEIPVTAVVLNNCQWGTPKKHQVTLLHIMTRCC